MVAVASYEGGDAKVVVLVQRREVVQPKREEPNDTIAYDI